MALRDILCKNQAGNSAILITTVSLIKDCLKAELQTGFSLIWLLLGITPLGGPGHNENCQGSHEKYLIL